VTRTHAVAALAAALTLYSHVASAQPQQSAIEEPDPTTVRIRMGPLWIAPTLAMTNIGVDSNVFNEPDELNPKSDFTFTLTPAADLWLHAGPTWVKGRIVEEVNWYQTYEGQRNANTGYTIGWHVPLARIGFKLDSGRRIAHDRPGYEIDTRVKRTESQYDALVEARSMSKTFVGVTAQRLSVDYDESAFYRATSLRIELNRVTTGFGLSLRHQLTPLTSISVTAGRTQDRFEFSSLRDSTSTNVTGHVAFDRFALIRGTASVGYTDFQPDSPGLEGFTGVTAAANLSYTLREATRFTFDLGRDVQYSYDVNQPYYLQTRVGGSVEQQIFGPLDVVVRGFTANLAYRSRDRADLTLTDRVDDVTSYGAGIGYHLGRDTRLGFNVDQISRTSDVLFRRYSNLTFGGSVTYGF
jgi:putative beta-barrel porin BBP2